VDLNVDFRSARALQGVVCGILLLGFVVDWRPVVLVAVIALAGLFVAYAESVRRYGRTWATEVGLLVLSAILFPIGRAGWAWFLAILAAGIAATAAIADVWIAPADEPQVRKPQ
jgi:hypothetical protein